MHPQHSTAAREAATTTKAGELPAALSNFDLLPDSAHVGAAVVRALYGVTGAATLWKWQRAGRIPKPKKIAGSNRNSWNVGEIRRALAANVGADHAPA